jgi:hypothetical protein
MSPSETIRFWKNPEIRPYGSLVHQDAVTEFESGVAHPAGDVTYLASCEWNPSQDSLSDELCKDYPSLFSYCPSDPGCPSCYPSACS